MMDLNLEPGLDFKVSSNLPPEKYGEIKNLNFSVIIHTPQNPQSSILIDLIQHFLNYISGLCNLLYQAALLFLISLML
jgi:hypothetical protein